MVMTVILVYFLCLLFPVLPVAIKAARSERKDIFDTRQASLEKSASAPPKALVDLPETRQIPDVVEMRHDE